MIDIKKNKGERERERQFDGCTCELIDIVLMYLWCDGEIEKKHKLDSNIVYFFCMFGSWFQ